MQDITPDILLRAYAAGIFPMAEDASAKELFWFDPPIRAILPLDAVHVPQRLRRTVKNHPYQVRIDTAFAEVIAACAEATPARKKTWINRQVRELYGALHEMGHAHSLEVWSGLELVGGLYGVHLGGAFFGESMFSRERDTSKIAFVYLAALMRHNGFTLLDCQFMTRHLARFGVHDISRADYHERLSGALKQPAQFSVEGDSSSLDGIALSFLQEVSQIS
ncbi:MAG: leucyl/phenylalanyl-tRNA--protein transferase [Alphaproteobacteria bacterium]|nr:leucyl/phenylalanyl-tRNA--protein transferase [Alphaproteobacteria bacterium]